MITKREYTKADIVSGTTVKTPAVCCLILNKKIMLVNYYNNEFEFHYSTAGYRSLIKNMNEYDWGYIR